MPPQGWQRRALAALLLGMTVWFFLRRTIRLQLSEPPCELGELGWPGGTGFRGPPMRLGSPPEMVRLILTSG